MSIEAMHAARLVAAESALRSLLVEAQADDAHDSPDEVVVRLHEQGMDLEFLRSGVPVAGEGL